MQTKKHELILTNAYAGGQIYGWIAQICLKELYKKGKIVEKMEK